MNYLPFQIGIVTFFLSAILDNLTSTIVMVSLLRKLVPPSEYRKYDFSTPVISAHSNFLLTIMSLFWLMMTISLHHYTYVHFMIALSGNVLNNGGNNINIYLNSGSNNIYIYLNSGANSIYIYLNRGLRLLGIMSAKKGTDSSYLSPIFGDN